MAVAEEKGGAPAGETYEEYLARQYAEGNVHSVPPAEQAPAPPPPAETSWSPSPTTLAAAEQQATDYSTGYVGDTNYYSPVYSTGTRPRTDLAWTGTPEEQLAYEQGMDYQSGSAWSTGGNPAGSEYAWRRSHQVWDPSSAANMPTPEETVNAFARATGQREMELIRDSNGAFSWVPRYPMESERIPAWSWQAESPDVPWARAGTLDERAANLAPATRTPSADDVPLAPTLNGISAQAIDPGFGSSYLPDQARLRNYYRKYREWLAAEAARQANNPGSPPILPPTRPDIPWWQTA